MHSSHLLLEEPIRMASILEPSKAVSISLSISIQSVFSFRFYEEAVRIRVDLDFDSFVFVFFSELFSGNDEDSGNFRSKISIRGSYFRLP